jgi:hypothetical protein
MAEQDPQRVAIPVKFEDENAQKIEVDRISPEVAEQLGKVAAEAYDRA